MSPEDVIAQVGTVVAGLLMASQLPAMYGVVAKRAGSDINAMSAAPTIGQAANFVSWSIYALTFGDPNLGRVNFIGCGFSVLYCGLFAVYTSGPARVAFLRLLAAFVLVMGGVSAAILAPPAIGHDLKVTLLGYIATGCNVIMYVFPLDAMRLAWARTDPSGIPILLVLAGLGCSLLWGTYGWLTSNYFVCGPNVAGVVLCSLQLLIAALVARRAVRAGKQLLEDDEDDSDPLLLSGGVAGDGSAGGGSDPGAGASFA